MFKDLASNFKNKKVFITGHTGFKGAWLTTILNYFGAEIKGYSLACTQDQDLFQQINGSELCYSSVIADINDLHTLQGEIIRFQPDYIFHLAAQALVIPSYEHPVQTFQTNVMGTINVLEAIRNLDKPCVGIMITTDKVYENNEQGIPFKENDKLGGYDPYSASKAACEIAIQSYNRSYFQINNDKKVITLRAGNVIGGGDFSNNRIIPDIVKSIQKKEDVLLRNPQSIRPWQHVLEPLFAYLMVAQQLNNNSAHNFAKAYNIGPLPEDELSVEYVTQAFIKAFGQGTYAIQQQSGQLHEAKTLKLAIHAIQNDFNWHPVLNATDAIAWTAQWYASKEPALTKTVNQITDYLNKALS